MITFKDFISEESQELDVDKFYADCKPFLLELRGIDEADLPKHGSRRAPSQWEIQSIKPRKGPRDTDMAIHSAIDSYFERRFGWPARTQSIFTTGDFDQAATYGPPSLIFPIGANFQTLWSEEVNDLYHVYDNIFSKLRREMAKPEVEGGQPRALSVVEFDRARAKAIEDTIDAIKGARWHHNAYIKAGYKSGNEVLLGCDKVYLIRAFSETYAEVRTKLKREGIIS